MPIDLKTSLLEYANGIEDRAGTSKLDVEVASLLKNGLINENVVADAIGAAASQKPDDTSRLWEGVAFLLRKLQLKSSKVGRVIEDRLDAYAMPPETRYQALTALSFAAGSLTPLQINRETAIKAEMPGHWLDLALDAYRGDPVGAKAAIASMLSAANPLDWRILRQRLPKLRDTFGGNLYGTAREFAGLMKDSEAKLAWLAAVDKRYGTNLADLESKPAERTAEEIRHWARPRVAAAVAPLLRFRPLEAMNG